MQTSASPKTPTKANRPIFQRSISAAADFSPPQRLPGIGKSTTAQQAAKKLHLPGSHGSDHSRKHHDKHRPGPAHVKRSPALTPGSGSGSKSRDDAQKDRIPEMPSPQIEAAPVKPSLRPVRPEDVVKERHRRGRRDEELRSTLGDLSELAHNSTRQLDNLYYSIVEKVSTLRATVVSLQDLAVQSVQLHGNFTSEASTLENEYKQQIDHFSEFKRQQQQVETLEQRIQKGVEKTHALSDRLETARNRVELWEKRENEWQARTSMRLRIGWGCAGAVMVLVVVLIVIRQLYTAPRYSHNSSQMSDARVINDTLIMEMRADFSAGVKSLATATVSASSTEVGSERRLHAFDEL